MTDDINELEQAFVLKRMAAKMALELFESRYGDVARDGVVGAPLNEEARALLMVAGKLAGEAVDASLAVDRAYEAAEERLAPPAQSFATRDEAEAWIERLEEDKLDAMERFFAARNELSNLDDPLSKEPQDITDDDWVTINRRFDLLEEMESVQKVGRSAQAGIDQARAALGDE
ncbi:hypothetical protein [Microbacterium sp.]|uniref:hypothetical protein n=1 Tax=Microbacterium sp. TaxID=51671 RepID=UPI00333F0DB8